MAPNLEAMLAAADAALIIGDAALKIDPARLSYPSLDLGEEWWKLTGLPMVFAIWAGRSQPLPLRESYEYGRTTWTSIWRPRQLGGDLILSLRASI
jgi:predicted solute-binding protein